MRDRDRLDHVNRGVVISVRGSVVDARFPQRLPSLYHVLRAGEDGLIVIEVISHIDSKTARGIALTSTQGLALGSEMVDTGHPLKVPVGRRLMGRVFNVFGETIDGKEPVTDGEWRTIHQEPVSLEEQSTASEIFVTGIKAIDVLSPLELGGKVG